MGELVEVPDPLCVGVAEPLKDALPVFDDEAPAVSEAVELSDRVEAPLCV